MNDNFEGMKITLEHVSGKGLGVVAQADIGKGKLVAYYLCKEYKQAHKSPNEYRVGAGVKGYVLDIFDGTFRPPEENIPYVAPLVNEPTSAPWKPNAKLAPAELEAEDGTLRRLGLWTVRKVKRGEELVIDYGTEYGKRSYPSQYD